MFSVNDIVVLREKKKLRAFPSDSYIESPGAEVKGDYYNLGSC